MSVNLKSIGSIFKQSGKDRAGSKVYPIMSITMAHGLVDQSEKFKKRIASKNTKGYRVVQKNELVVGFPIDEGVLGFLTKYPAAIVSPAYGIWALKDPDRTHIPYLEIYLRSSQARALYASNMQGAVARRRSLKKNVFLSLKIPFPKYDDQIRIATLLNRVKALIANRKENLRLLDEFLKSTFLEMFGDLVENEKEGNRYQLKRYITHITSGGRGWAKYYSNSGKRFIRSLDVRMNDIGNDDVVYVDPPKNKEADRTKIQSNDVLLTITGSKIGRVCCVPPNFEEAYISQHVALIRTQGINPVYLSYFLSMENGGQRIIKKKQYGQAKPGLNLTQIKEFSIPVPSNRLQEQFASVAIKVGEIKKKYEQNLTGLENLYGVLSQKAFKGELDLSNTPIEKIEVNEKKEKPLSLPEVPLGKVENHVTALKDLKVERNRKEDHQLQNPYAEQIPAESPSKVATSRTTEADLDFEAFKRILAKYSMVELTFEDIKEILGEKLFDYQEVKGFMQLCLEGKKPFLCQKFDQNKGVDQMFFCVNK